MFQVCKKIILTLVLFPLVGYGATECKNYKRAVEAEIVEFGIYERLGNIVSRNAAESAAGRVDEVDEFFFVEKAESVALKKGITFGYRYRLSGVQEGDNFGYEMRVKHPPMTGVDGKTHTISVGPVSVFGINGVEVQNISYTLSEDYELVSGEWLLQVFYCDKLLLEKKFYVK